MTMDGKQMRECLADAGCDAALIERFDALRGSGRLKEQLRLLGEYRRLLLDRIHAEQKKLDCLDYLLWTVNPASQRRKQP